jgi:DNA helicase HerA-like ATPase
VLGTSLYPADIGQLVTLPVATCLHHLHVTGVTGSGKSTLLANFIRADMAAGHSVLVIEPRGDLVTDVLNGVPASRRDDVVLIEPGSAELVVGFNPLAGPLADAERRADDLLHLFHELYSGVGPRSSDVLLHALTALARLSDGTLADLPVLLTNSRFRRQVLTGVTDPLVLAPFFAWYDGLSEGERAQVIAPVLNKTRAFLSRSAIRRLLGQATPRFQLDELFTEHRIVLVNLNAGLIGAETAQLIGALLVTQLWQAIQRRAGTSRSHRYPVMLVIDEVQNYLKLPVDVGDMLAQARGLGVSLTAAHQHLGQLTPSLRAAFQANARSKIVLRPSADDREPLAKALGGGVKAGDVEQLGAYEAYARVLVDGAMSQPFMVKTRPLPIAIGQVAELRALSQQRYGVDGRELDDLLQQRWQGSSDRPSGPIGVGRRRTP